MMKRLFFLVAILFALNSAFVFAQTDTSSIASEKSLTISALSTAQEEVIKEILTQLYASNGKIDVVKQYETLIRPRIAECLKIDMTETGIKVQNNALEGKFKKVKLKFEKPSDKKFKISGKVKRKYLRAYKSFKKEFVEDRKSKNLDEVFGQKNLTKKVDKVAKVMTKEFKKNIRKVSK